MSVLVKGDRVYIDKYHLQLPMLALEWVSKFAVQVTVDEEDEGEMYYFVLRLSKPGIPSETLAHSMCYDLEKQI